MKGILDGQSIEIPCKNCGGKTEKTIGWLKTHTQFVCACGTKITLDASDLKRKVSQVDAGMAKLKRTIESINKRR